MTKKLGERLVEAGLVTSASIDKALEHQQITGHRLGDCLVDLSLVQEAVLLRFLATGFQTRFVSTEKLARAKIQTEVLDRLPVRMAEAHNILPLAYDPERKLLSVVAAEPQNKQLLDELARVAGISGVYAYVGLRSAIAAAIKKHYYGDPTAFSNLEPNAPGVMRADVSAMASAYESTAGTHPRTSTRLGPRMETDPRLRQGTQARPFPATGRGPLSGLMRGAGVDGGYLETLNILVTLLEKERKHHRGHSAHLARLASEIARRMGMSPRDVASVAITAYLHDLGKPANKHFCLASNAVNPEWKAEAKRYCRMPTRLFETVHLPPQVNTMLAQLYEAYDGSGTPQGVKGEDITLGARILAAVDSFLELTKNPANAYGRTMTKDQALAHLRENAGLLYDPMVADIVMQVQSGALLRQRLVTDGRQILIVDPEEGTRTDLLESTQRQELVAHALSTLEGAYDALANQDCDVLSVGLKFRLPEVLGLLRAARTTAESAGLPVVVLGEPDAATREQLMLGGATAVVSPADPDAAAGVIRALYDDRILHNGPARVVCGSLDEVPAPELLKTLGTGRKSGRLHLKHHAHEGFLHLEQGRVVFAAFGGQLGAQAMQLLLGLPQADFRYEPDSLLLDVPHLDMDLEELAWQAATRGAAAS